MCLWVQPQDGMQTRHMTGHTNNRPAHTNRWTWSDGAHRVKEGSSKERWWRLVQPLWNIKCTSERPPNCSSFVHLCPDKEGPAWPNWFWSSLPLNWFLQDFPDNISTLATQLECHAPERLPNCIWFCSQIFCPNLFACRKSLQVWHACVIKMQTLVQIKMQLWCKLDNFDFWLQSQKQQQRQEKWGTIC